MKLIAVVVTYYPNQGMSKNILKYIDYVDKLIIWDNTEQVDQNKYLLKLPENDDKIVRLGTGKNEGIAYALNRAFEWAISNGYEYILTMDQDSYWEDFSYYKSAIERKEKNHVAIYAPLIKSGGKILRCNNRDFVITSGSIYNLSLFQLVGLFREDFFIDEVDNEYCIRVAIKGYRILILDDCYLSQVFGSPQNKSFLDRYTGFYSPMRTYYQIRNRMWVWREYSRMLSYRYLLRTLLYQVLRRSLIIIIYEHNKRSKLYAIVKGLWHGCFGDKNQVEFYSKFFYE